MCLYGLVGMKGLYNKDVYEWVLKYCGDEKLDIMFFVVKEYFERINGFYEMCFILYWWDNGNYVFKFCVL